MMGRSLYCPIFFESILHQKYNTPARHGHKIPRLNSNELREVSETVFGIVSQPWLAHTRWALVYAAVEELAALTSQYTNYLENKSREMQTVHNSSTPIRTPEKNLSHYALSKSTHASHIIQERYCSLRIALTEAEVNEPVFVNDFSPSLPSKRHMYLKQLSLPFATHVYQYPYGNNLGTLTYIWRTSDNDLETVSRIIAGLTFKHARYHTRAMKKDFQKSFVNIQKVTKQMIRTMYKLATGDDSAAINRSTAEVDERMWYSIIMGDPEIIVDLRYFNERKEIYQVFWEQLGLYLDNRVAPNERRHGEIGYSAIAMSVRDLVAEVKKTCPPDTSIPSENWVRFQFWPKNPFAKIALQYTGRFAVKYKVQVRQLRQSHPDAHYAGTISTYFSFCLP